MMEIKGNTIILDAGEEVTIKAREKEEVVPTPTPPSDETVGRLDLFDLIGRFNNVLTERGYNAIDVCMDFYDCLKWAYTFANDKYMEDAWMFRPSKYPLVYDYRGDDETDDGTAYNAMQAFIMASFLVELVPDSGEFTNTQTKLYKLAYEIGGGATYPLYNDKAFKADPYSMREAGSVIHGICRGDKNIAAQIEQFRSELGGSPIPASCWDDLGFEDEEITDEYGRKGYRVKRIGYLINTREFLPDAPAPRVEGTTVCELPMPYEQGQPKELFNEEGNYIMDEVIYDYMVKNWNMMTQTPLEVWNSYGIEKQNRLVNVAAIPPNTLMYMFSRKKVRFDGLISKSYDGVTYADYYCFSRTSENTGLALDGAFSDLEGIIRYNASPMNARETFLKRYTETADKMRYSTQSPNYGRCRPGCKNTREGGERVPVHGAEENEIYNVDLTTMVADDASEKAYLAVQDGFAADSPRSYVSGHSAQIWALALAFIQMNNEGNCETWVRKAFEYSVNRSVGRFHWNSDCVYGRLFGAMTLPIMNAMTGMRDGYEATKSYVLNPQPAPTGEWGATVIIKNETFDDIVATGEVRLYVGGHEYGINFYEEPVGQYVLSLGENEPYDTNGIGNQFELDDSFGGMVLDDNARIYIYDSEYGHIKSEDANLKVILDTDDPRCSHVLSKSGATYVLRIVYA